MRRLNNGEDQAVFALFFAVLPALRHKVTGYILRGAGKRISLCVLLEGKTMAKSIASRLRALEKMVARLLSPQKRSAKKKTKKKKAKKKPAARKAAPKRKTKKPARRSRREPIIVPPPIML
jgi:hypothetical protein